MQHKSEQPESSLNTNLCPVSFRRAPQEAAGAFSTISYSIQQAPSSHFTFSLVVVLCPVFYFGQLPSKITRLFLFQQTSLMLWVWKLGENLRCCQFCSASGTTSSCLWDGHKHLVVRAPFPLNHGGKKSHPSWDNIFQRNSSAFHRQGYFLSYSVTSAEHFPCSQEGKAYATVPRDLCTNANLFIALD